MHLKNTDCRVGNWGGGDSQKMMWPFAKYCHCLSELFLQGQLLVELV